MRLSKNFTSSEFACPCCGQSKMNPEFIARLQRVRDEYGKPFSPVTGGGYRCADYSKSKHSAHGEGRAIDPNIPKQDYYSFIKIAMQHDFRGIGIKNRDGHWQLHIDDAAEIDNIRPRPTFWTY